MHCGGCGAPFLRNSDAKLSQQPRNTGLSLSTFSDFFCHCWLHSLCICVYLQVLANDPPMLPYQLFRHLAQQAYISQQAAQEAAAAGGSIGGSAYYSAPDDEGGSGFGAEDFDLGEAGVQGLAGDLFAGGAADAVIDDGAVDDEEMQGMSAGWTRG